MTRLLVAAAISAAPLSSSADLVAYWDFEPDSPYLDKSGNGADGSAGANVSIDSGGPLGDAVAIGISGAAPDEIVTVPQDSFPALGENDFSFSFWVKRDADGTDTNVDGIFDALFNTTQGFQALFMDSHVFRFRIDEDPGGDFLLADSNATFPPDGTWHHIAVTIDRDQADGLKIYADGQFDSAHDPTMVSGSQDLRQDFWIGAINSNATLGLEGSLDDLAFYDVLLTPEQIASLASMQRNPLTVFAPPVPAQLGITHTDGNLRIEWESEDGMLYNLRAASDPGSAPPAEWPLFDPDSDGRFQDMVATSPTNMVTLQLPMEAAHFFVIEEFPEPPEVIYFEDFENAPSEWAAGSDGQPGTTWELGMPSNLGPPSAHSPTNCYGTNLTGPYATEADVWLRSPEIDLTTAPGATLHYFRFVDIELVFDLAEVRVLDATNDSPIAVLESAIDGLSADWEAVRNPLPPAALGKTVRIEFRLITDDFIDGMDFAGFYVDDVQVTVP